MAKTNPFQFLQQVRTETSKVTWPTRRETAITSMMVFMFVILASIFFMLVDFTLTQVVGLILGIGR
jgi:preprotein translocase subunit SecE